MRIWFSTFPRVKNRRLQWGQQYFLREKFDNGFPLLTLSFFSPLPNIVGSILASRATFLLSFLQETTATPSVATLFHHRLTFLKVTKIYLYNRMATNFTFLILTFRCFVVFWWMLLWFLPSILWGGRPTLKSAIVFPMQNLQCHSTG
jgi:hypothetical protein